MRSRPCPVLSFVLLSTLFVGCGGQEPDADEVNALTYGVAGRVWPVQRLGKSGTNVVVAQYLLRHHGQTLAVDGAYGWGTYTAAKKFQSKVGLGVDGVVGGMTWEAMTTLTQRGHSGSQVRAAQHLLLKRYGYGISVTGQFGPTTEQRVRQFQQARCLKYVDGVVGTVTWHSLVANVSHCGSSSGLGFVNPAPGWPVTSEFGSCRDGCTRLHEGIDLGTPSGTPIRAARSGTVVFAGWLGGYGYCVDISHGGTYTTRYAHLSQIKAWPYQWVSQGSTIALSGNSGVGTGPHLHFEIRLGGRWGVPQNPRNYVSF